jgi:hypothetical protein
MLYEEQREGSLLALKRNILVTSADANCFRFQRFWPVVWIFLFLFGSVRWVE